MNETLLTKGFGNRLLIIAVPKPPFSADTTNCTDAVFLMLQDRLKDSLKKAGIRDRVDLEDDAKARFIEFAEKYYNLAEEDERVDFLLKRFHKHCLKLALIIALINGEEKISLATMEMACAFMEYSRASIHAIFNGQPWLPSSNIILDFVSEKGGTVRRSDITAKFASQMAATKQNELLHELLSQNKLISRKVRSGVGRQATVYSLPE